MDLVKILGTILALNMALILAMPLSVSQTVGSEPANIRLSWSDESASTTMTVSWETSGSGNPGTVEYGISTGYGSTASGTSHLDAYDTNYIHEARLTGLEPGTLYHYRVSGDSGTWSADHTFRTGPGGWEEFSFFAIGDSQKADDDWATMVGLMESRPGPDFVLAAGDILNDWTYDQYDSWMDKAGGLISERPYLSCRGNHDDNLAMLTDTFAWPGNEHWFSLNYSNAHFIILDSEEPSSTQQLTWLENDLVAASQDQAHPWIFVTFHKPAYCSGTNDHAPSYTVQTKFVPLFEEYGVDLVFTGHNHYYERMAALDSTQSLLMPQVSMWGPEYTDSAHPVYFVVGWTSTYDDRVSDNGTGYVQSWHDDKCVLEVTVDEDEVHIQCIDASGSIRDEAWLSKTGIEEPSGVQAPGAPGNLTVELGENCTSLAWEPPSDDGGSVITGYRVLRGISPSNLTLLDSVGVLLTYSDYKIEPGQTYHYQVQALNSAGQGSGSNTASITIQPESDGPGDDDEAESSLLDYWWLVLVAIILGAAFLLMLIPNEKSGRVHYSQEEMARLREEAGITEKQPEKAEPEAEPEPEKKQPPKERPPIDLSDLPKAAWEE